MCGSCVLALTSQFTLLRNNKSHEDRGARFGKLTNVVVSRNVVRKDLYRARSLLTRGLLARWSVKTEKHLRLRIVGNHRSEERRVGKECRSEWATWCENEKNVQECRIARRRRESGEGT